MNKRLVLLVVFIGLSGLLWAQQGRAAFSFEGTWDSHDNDEILHFIFKGDNLIIVNSDNGEIMLGTFTHDDKFITFTAKHLFVDTEWQTAPGNGVNIRMDYIFNRKKLTIVFNGDSVVCEQIE